MREHLTGNKRTATRLHRAISMATSLGCLLVSAPVYAQTTTATAASPWVRATLLAVMAVFGLWLVAVGFFLVARKFRLMSSHRHLRLSRALQVAFGGLLLAAVFMPYLVMNHPLVATAVLLGGVVLAACVGTNQPRWSGESQPPHS